VSDWEILYAKCVFFEEHGLPPHFRVAHKKNIMTMKRMYGEEML
jgi:hypothetical protein